jgi:hypothetical protein
MMNLKRASKFVFFAFLLSLIGIFAVNDRNGVTLSDLAEPSWTSEKAVPAGEREEAPINRQKLSEVYGNLPINLEPNVGQADESVRFVARGNSYSLFLGDAEARLELRGGVKSSTTGRRVSLNMKLDGADPSALSRGLDEAESKSNYFVGNDPEKWRTEIPNFRTVKYEQIYPGIDLVYYGNGQKLEYDFVVEPNADPRRIALAFSGALSARIDKLSGDLHLTTTLGVIRQLKPVVYQVIDGVRHEIASSYRLQRKSKGEALVAIDVGEYDHSNKLTIDPVLAYGSYLGGTGFEEGRGIAVDGQGNAYVVGTTASLNFPTTAGTIKPNALPRTDLPGSYWNDAFVTKVNPTGTALVWSTYYGGRNGSEIGTGVTVSPNGDVLISGTTTASDLPTVNAYQPVFGGTDDAFAAKLNATGSAIVYSTYLGGNNTDTGGRIALNRTTGDAVFAGFSSSPDFPTTPGAYKQKLCDSPITCSGIFYSGSYVVKLTASGTAVYSSLFDAGISDVTLDASDNALIGGSVSVTNFPTTPGAFQPASSGGIEGFLAKLNPAGNSLVYGTYLGGGFQSDRVNGVTIDSAGNMYATGQTQNTAFPVTAGAFDETYNGGEDGFVTKLNPAGSALVYSTFFGGQAKDQPFAIRLGPDNSVLIAGETFSGPTFPLRNSLVGNVGSIFVTRFDSNATSIIYSTLVGQGGAYGLAVDGTGSAFITGHTTNIVVTPNAFQPDHGATDPTSSSSSPKDAFVMKIATADENAPSYAISGTVTDDNYGFNNDYSPIVVKLSGTVNRSYSPPNAGNGTVAYYFGNLPPGGSYTITAHKAGYETDPANVVFNNLGANQSADFHILRNQAPTGVITLPVHGTTYNAPATFTIQATAIDPDGDAIQKVDFVAYSSAAGNIPLGTDATAPYEFTWTNVPVGTFALYAIPTDSHGLRGISTEVVHVFIVDPAVPSVNITAPVEGQTASQGEYVTLSASVSSSITVLEFLDQTNTIIGRRIEAPWTTQWRPMDAGNYTITAKGYTSQGQTVFSEPVHIVISPINHRITGTIVDSITFAPLGGVTLSLVCPSTPSITAQTTTDTNGNYLFTNLGTTPNDGVTITPNLAGYSFDPPNRSTGYLGYITNWTNQNYNAVRTTGISVSLTSPTDGQVFTAPASINLAASASSSAGTITRVDFYLDAFTPVLIGADTTAPFEFPVNGLAAGSYRYFARATDSTNAVTDSAVVNITVNPPVTSVRLQGEVHNPGGGPMAGIIVRLAGTANGNPVNQSFVTNVNGAYGFFSVPAGGNYTITPEAPNMAFTPPSASFTNATQDTFDINFVASAVNQPPVVQMNSPTDGAVYTMPAAIPINVTAADADGSIVYLQVLAQSRTMSTTIGQANSGSLSFNWQPNLPGVYTLWAEARDNGGLRTMVGISITVDPPSAVSVSGRIVDRNSQGIAGATVEMRSYPTEGDVIASAVTDATGNYRILNVTTFNSYILRASKQNYSFSPQKRTYFNISVDQTTADYTGTLQVQLSDFDGDGGSDLAVWRPSTGVWHISGSANDAYWASQFGGAAFGDIVVPGNYDGDKKIDYAVFRNGIWYILNSSSGAVRFASFGLAGDLPVPGDYDGDGKTDIAVFRPGEGNWYIWRSSDGGYDFRHLGQNGDVPLAGDFDGDGVTDLAVWRPNIGTWYVLQSSDGNMAAVTFGQSGDLPLIGDFDGDKKSDYAVYRPSNGVWYVLRSSDFGFRYMQWGNATDNPVPGDYDRDGKTDFAVFRGSEGNWYIFRSSTGLFTVTHFGIAGDIPIPAAFVR